MKHRIISKLEETSTYEIVQVELIPASEQEKKEIHQLSDRVQDYLTLTLNTVQIIEERSPVFFIKRVKSNTGIGNY